MLESIWLDTVTGARIFRRAPALAAAVVLTMSLGVGLSSVLLTLFSGLFLRANVGHAPDTYVRVFVTVDGGAIRAVSGEPTSVTLEEFDAIRAGTKTLSVVTAAAWATFELTGDTTAQLRGQWVSCTYLAAHVPQVVLGRSLTPEDCASTDTPAAVLAARTWANVFGRAPDVVGRRLQLNGQPVVIVGVVPDTPVRDAVAAQIYLPFTRRGVLDPASDPFSRPAGQQAWLSLSGRRAPHATHAAVAAELQGIVDSVSRPQGRTATVVATDGAPVHDPSAGRHLPAVAAAGAAAITLVLLLTSANVAMLLVARVVAREREVATRHRLGASRARLLQLLVIEGAVLALPAALAGTGLAFVVPDLVAARLSQFPLAVALEPDRFVLLVVAGLTLVAGGGSGVWSALHAARVSHAANVTSTPRSHAWLLAPQVAVALTLVATVVLVSRAEGRLQQPDVRYEPATILTATVPHTAWTSLSATAPGPSARLLRDVQGISGVVHAALSSPAPFAGDSRTLVSAADTDVRFAASVRSVSAGYFALTDMHLREGRLWDDTRAWSGQGVAEVVASSALRARIGEARLLPFRLTLDGARTVVVVGVVADTTSIRADRPDGPLLYLPVGEVRTPDVTVLASGPSLTPPGLRLALSRTSAGPTVVVETIADALARASASHRIAADLMSAVAGLALVLAALGIAGAIAFVVERRRREIAVRLALGAAHLRLVIQCMSAVARPVAAGAAVGLLLSLVVALTMRNVFTVSATLLPSLLWPIAIVATTSAVAALVPAWRAVQASVWTSLRSE